MRGVAVTKGSLILRRGGCKRRRERGRIPDKAYSACVQLEPKAAMAAEAREREHGESGAVAFTVATRDF